MAEHWRIALKAAGLVRKRGSHRRGAKWCGGDGFVALEESIYGWSISASTNWHLSEREAARAWLADLRARAGVSGE